MRNLLKLMIYRETKTRSFLKALSWRIWATLATIMLVFIFTGQLMLAAALGSVEVVLKLVLYFIHERTWDRVQVGRYAAKPFVLWFTGLPSSGKSTLAEALVNELREKGHTIEWLDGDVIREMFPNTGFEKEERDRHVKQIGVLASMLERNGIIVAASFVSPYREARQFVREKCENFVEVYVATGLDECEKRDVKGLYRKARAGEIQNFTGLDDPYEPPVSPELTIETEKETVEQSLNQIRDYLRSQELLGEKARQQAA